MHTRFPELKTRTADLGSLILKTRPGNVSGLYSVFGCVLASFVKGTGFSKEVVATIKPKVTSKKEGKIEKRSGAGYDATNIQILEGTEAVRMRPAMYIGDTFSRGLHHLVYEVVDNSVDEAMGGYCTEIEVIINENDSVTVIDNGRGIPVDMHKTEKKPAVEVVLTTLHAGGKFDHRTYKVSGGLHGVGVSCVNALSEWLEVEVKRDGEIYHQRYEKGITKTKLTKIGKTKTTGTKVTFKPDKTIFKEITVYSYDILAKRLRELALKTAGLLLSSLTKGQRKKWLLKVLIQRHW